MSTFRSHSSTFLSAQNWTCEVVFRVHHARFKSWEHGCKRAATVVNVHGYHQMSSADILRLAKGQDSYNRSLQRRAEMTRTQKAQIAAIGESRSLWYALRRHGTKAQCAEWLNILHSNSTRLDDKESDDEVLRRQYLHLWEAVRSFEPKFVDDEMKRRQEREPTLV